MSRHILTMACFWIYGILPSRAFLGIHAISAEMVIEDMFSIEPDVVHHVVMGKDGRIVIPANIRSQVNMPKGGAFVVRVEDGVVTLEPLSHAIAAVQAMMKPYAIEGVSIVDELIADRRAEAAREGEEEGR